MKKFKPFEKILYRYQNMIWYPSFYQCFHDKYHFVIGEDEYIEDKDIIPYEGNEHLVGTTDEPEEEITIKYQELILCADFCDNLEHGLGEIKHFRKIEGLVIGTIGDEYNYCIPMSKYNPNNLEETRKWILKVKNGRFVKVNK